MFLICQNSSSGDWSHPWMCKLIFKPSRSVRFLTWASPDSSFQPLPLSFCEKTLVKKKWNGCMRCHQSKQQWIVQTFAVKARASWRQQVLPSKTPMVAIHSLHSCWHCWHITQIIAARNVCGHEHLVKAVVYPLSHQRCYARKAAAGNVWVIGNQCRVVEKLKWPLGELDSCRGHRRSRTHSDMRVGLSTALPSFCISNLTLQSPIGGVTPPP